jgi:hypothetical protein
VKTDIEYVPQQQEIAVDKQQSQEVLKGQEIENLIVARKHADVSQDEMLIPQRVDSSQPRREWQKPLSQPLRPQHLFAQVQGSPLKEVKEKPESSAHEIHSSSSEDAVLLSTQMLSEDKWEENNLTVSTIEEDLDKKDPDVPGEDKEFGKEEVVTDVSKLCFHSVNFTSNAQVRTEIGVIQMQVVSILGDDVPLSQSFIASLFYLVGGARDHKEVISVG